MVSLNKKMIPGCVAMESIPADLVKSLLAAGNTYSQISSYLKQQYPHISRGLSERSIRRYVKENDLKEEVKSDALEAVKESVREVSIHGFFVRIRDLASVCESLRGF